MVLMALHQTTLILIKLQALIVPVTQRTYLNHAPLEKTTDNSISHIESPTLHKKNTVSRSLLKHNNFLSLRLHCNNMANFIRKTRQLVLKQQKICYNMSQI